MDSLTEKQRKYKLYQQQYKKQYYKDNKERLSEYQNNWIKNNPSYHRDYQRARTMKLKYGIPMNKITVQPRPSDNQNDTVDVLDIHDMFD